MSVFDLYLDWHLRVVKEPVLDEKAQLILAVDEGNMHADIERVLEW